jgi:major type 1 subunit fimbrin (pilin)
MGAYGYEIGAAETGGALRRYRTRLLRVLALWIALCGTMWTGSAFATLKCVAVNASNANLATVPKMSVSSATPDNTVLWQTTVVTTTKCGIDSVLTAPEDIFLWRSNYLNLGNGLALYISYNGDNGSTLARFDTGTQITKLYLQTGTNVTINIPLTISLVKVGAVSATGKMPVGYIQAVYVGSNGTGTVPAGGGSQTYTVHIGNGTIGVTPATCSPNQTSQNVQMGTIALGMSGSLGTGVGTTSADVPFNVQLTCDSTISGTFGIFMQMDATAINAKQGLFSLSGGSTASGVGIQVTQNGQPITLGQPWQIASFPLTSTNLSIPFAAHYYQTGATASAGSANGVATYTITYQ